MCFFAVLIQVARIHDSIFYLIGIILFDSFFQSTLMILSSFFSGTGKNKKQ